MKLMAALRQRLAFSAEIGFCRTKFAPIWNACCVVVLPLRMAKVTEFLLLSLLRKPPNTVSAPFRSSQSTMMASNFSLRRISCPRADPAADLDIDGKLFQGGFEDTNDFEVPAEEQRFQRHRTLMVGFRFDGVKVTKVH